jgi:hypothetical protein
MLPATLLASILVAWGTGEARAAAFVRNALQRPVIYFTTDPNLSARAAADIQTAVDAYNAALKGCVAFTRLTDLKGSALAAASAAIDGGQASRITFMSSTYCSEDCIGNRREVNKQCEPGGPQIIHVSPDYCDSKTLLHEIGHKLGMIHEHARPDRDTWVRLRWENMDREAEKKGYDLNYAFGVTQEPVNPHGDFDYASIMIYGSCEFSKTQSEDAPESCKQGTEVLLKTDGSRIPAPARLSATDVSALKEEYRCP